MVSIFPRKVGVLQVVKKLEPEREWSTDLGGQWPPGMNVSERAKSQWAQWKMVDGEGKDCCPAETLFWSDQKAMICRIPGTRWRKSNGLLGNRLIASFQVGSFVSCRAALHTGGASWRRASTPRVQVGGIYQNSLCKRTFTRQGWSRQYSKRDRKTDAPTCPSGPSR